MKKENTQKNIGAIGEELVKYHLLARDWDVINLNSIGNNKPNADLLAVKGKHAVRIQVKTSRYKDWVHLGWIGVGKSNINARIGDPADFFAMVGHAGPGDYKIYIVPAGLLKNWEARALASKGDKGGKGYIYFGEEQRNTKSSVNQNSDEFAKFRDAWDLLEEAPV